ncbi:hypothetical protein OFN64_37040, partial [Escherichia coli]|nr:hypothetical protein [Escherichia coli]
AIEPPPKAAKDALDSAAPLKDDIAVPPAVVPKTPVAPMLAAIAGAATPAVAIPTTVPIAMDVLGFSSIKSVTAPTPSAATS